MPIDHYEDAVLKVETGIDLRVEKGADVPKEYIARDLSDSIKMSVKTPGPATEVRFIQFVTRLFPNLFSYNESGRITKEWEDIGKHYTTDLRNPHWKIDVPEKSVEPYYLRNKGELCTILYDNPGGASEPLEERSVFCTYVIVDNQVTHQIKWSKQVDMARKHFYVVEVDPACRQLPDWAIAEITRNYNGINERSFALPPELVRATDLTDDQLREQASTDMLPPPREWITLRDFGSLFPAPRLEAKPAPASDEPAL